MRSPFLVLSSRSPVTMPPTVTSPFAAFCASVPVVALAHCASSERKRSSGWPEMKKPSDSFSNASRSASGQGGTSGIRSRAASAAAGASSIPNRLDWPASRSRWRFCPASMARSIAAKSAARRGSIESKHPLLMKLSTTRRLTARRSTRSQKSNSERKRPALRRGPRARHRRRPRPRS